MREIRRGNRYTNLELSGVGLLFLVKDLEKLSYGKLVAKEGNLVLLIYVEGKILKKEVAVKGLGKTLYVKNFLAGLSIHIKSDKGITAAGCGKLFNSKLIKKLAARGCLARLGLVGRETLNKALKLGDLLFVALILHFDHTLDKLAGLIPELVVTNVHLDS